MSIDCVRMQTKKQSSRVLITGQLDIAKIDMFINLSGNSPYRRKMSNPWRTPNGSLGNRTSPHRENGACKLAHGLTNGKTAVVLIDAVLFAKEKRDYCV